MNNNRKEVNLELTSQLLQGIAGGLTGGATTAGAVVTVGCYLVFADKQSNQQHTLGDDAATGAKQYGAGVAEGAGEAAGKNAMAAFETWVWKNITFARIVTGAGEESVNSAANMWGMASNAPKYIWGDFAKSAGMSLGGAVVGFAIAEAFTNSEGKLERATGIIPDGVKPKDSKNDIGIIAKDVL